MRLALEVLSRASVEREAIEAATWAIENGPAWRAKVHKLVVAMAALLEADAEATAFVDAAGGGRADALPHMGIYRSYGGIDIAGWTSLKGVFDLAVDEGVAKAAELKGARNAR